MKQSLAIIASNTEILPDTHLIWLQAPEVAKVAQPGQFVMVRCGDSHDLLLRRPFSIHRVANGGQIALLFNIVGRGTEWLARCQKGDPLDLLGPLGKGFSLQSASSRLLLVAGGIGIAPLVFLAEKGLNQGGSIRLLMGAPNATSLYPRSLLSPSIDLVTVTEDGSEGRKGMVTELISDFINQADQVFACGPASMYQSMVAQSCLKGRSVQISLEVRMGCGLGACYGCTIKTKRGLQQVCRDGPVFELDDILW